MSRFVLVCSIFFMSSCNHMFVIPHDRDFIQSAELITESKKACTKNIKGNKLIARKECFPTLTDKEILIQVNEIDDSLGTVTLFGTPGVNRYRVWCQLSKEDSNQFLHDPSQVAIGGKYIVSGEYSNFSTGTHLDFFTLKNCKFKVNPTTKPIASLVN